MVSAPYTFFILPPLVFPACVLIVKLIFKKYFSVALTVCSGMEWQDTLCGIIPYDDQQMVLPLICLERIVQHAVQMDISARHRMAQVCKFFNSVVEKVPKHSMYFNDSVCSVLGLPFFVDETTPTFFITSTRKIVRHAGRGSGAVIEFRAKFNNVRWIHSWMELKRVGFGWFEVHKVFWRVRSR